MHVVVLEAVEVRERGQRSRSVERAASFIARATSIRRVAS
jgi:hypothetical protein